jgi:hypothetical protein
MILLFKYRARDEEGKSKDGLIEAVNEDDAVKQLQEQGLIIISIEISEHEKGIRPWEIEKSTIVIILSIIAIVSLSFLLVGKFVYEEKVFKETKTVNKIESYRFFIQRFPKSRFLKEVNVLLEKRYEEGLEFCSDLIIHEAERCILICSEYSRVWNKAIERQVSFESAILKLQEALNSENIYESLRKMKYLTEKMMEKLIDPPLRYNESYKKLVNLYGVYSQVYAFAVQPSGSLLTFNNSINDLQSQLIKLKNELNAMLRIKENDI